MSTRKAIDRIRQVVAPPQIGGTETMDVLKPTAYSLSSPSFQAASTIPTRYTCDGEDISPALAWHGAPAGTRSFLLVMDDPDAPSGLFTHWIQYDMPVTPTVLDEGEARGTAGRNSFGRLGYGGPCPPPGRGAHRYFFRLHALDVEGLGIQRGADRHAVLAAAQAHVLGTAELMGLFGR